MTREENPRDRLIYPDPDTSEYSDRTELGREPVDETDDTVEEPEAHRPRVADADRGTSESTAEDEAGEVAAPVAVPAPVPTDVDQGGPLLRASDANQIRTRWHEVQASFVDDPTKAVDEAAQLVSHAADRVTSVLKHRLSTLDEGRSNGKSAGDDTATEQLRNLMQRYHVLLDRMLAA